MSIKKPVVLMFIPYAVISAFVFHKVYESSQMVVDEEFHLRQAKHYCDGEFSEWDPKITTFPGLYIVSTILTLPFGGCTTYTLRLTSLLASIINVWLIYKIREFIVGKQKNGKSELEALTISFLPPLYFFAHLYYTDILSLTAVLGLVLFNLKNEHNIAALFGFFSVIMRQTNIIWVGMALGITVIDKFVMTALAFIKGNEKYGKPEYIYTFKDILSVLGFYCKRFYLIPKQIKLLVTHLIGYILVLILFLVFILVNGSIVVGDKSAHEAALHIPQIFYFILFFIVFGISMVFNNLSETIKSIYQNWLINTIVMLSFIGIVYLNTIVHPYLLADNRHYTFYIWNKFYGAYSLAKYVIIPFYLFGFIAAYKCIGNKSTGFKIIYTLCTICVLAFQQLIELRYFLIPFLLLRLHTSGVKTKWLFLEFVTYVIINMAVFYQFFTKEIYWNDFEDVQRLMW